jgi:hypothetical protein
VRRLISSSCPATLNRPDISKRSVNCGAARHRRNEQLDEAASKTTQVRPCLEPSLPPGDIVVIDNPPAHRPDVMCQIIEAAGATLRYWLRPYSPDLNPIEQTFAKFKARPKNAASPPSMTASVEPSKPSRPANSGVGFAGSSSAIIPEGNQEGHCR